MIPLWNTRVFVAWAVLVAVGYCACRVLAWIVERAAERRRFQSPAHIAELGPVPSKDPLSRFLRWQWDVRDRFAAWRWNRKRRLRP